MRLLKTGVERPSFGLGFTLLELLLVMVIISILATLLLPALAKVQSRVRRTACLSNLKQVGIGFHSFAHEHNNLFPMQVSTNEGGSLEFLNAATGQSDFTYRHFQTLASEIGTPKVLRCPADTRTAAINFSELRNENISYFLGANAVYTKPETILAGDRTLKRLGPVFSSILYVSPESLVEWSAGLHEKSGNLLFADAHVETFTTHEAQAVLAEAGNVTMLLTPSIAPTNLAPISGAARTVPASSLGPMSKTNNSAGSGKTNHNAQLGTNAGAGELIFSGRDHATGIRSRPGTTLVQTNGPDETEPEEAGEAAVRLKITLEKARKLIATFSSRDHYGLLWLLLALAVLLQLLRRRLQRRQLQQKRQARV